MAIYLDWVVSGGANLQKSFLPTFSRDEMLQGFAGRKMEGVFVLSTPNYKTGKFDVVLGAQSGNS
jgi:hypothetical protein